MRATTSPVSASTRSTAPSVRQATQSESNATVRAYCGIGIVSPEQIVDALPPGSGEATGSGSAGGEAVSAAGSLPPPPQAERPIATTRIRAAVLTSRRTPSWAAGVTYDSRHAGRRPGRRRAAGARRGSRAGGLRRRSSASGRAGSAAPTCRSSAAPRLARSSATRSLPRTSRGARVALVHHLPCGECARCRAGHETTCERFPAPRSSPAASPSARSRPRRFPFPTRSTTRPAPSPSRSPASCARSSASPGEGCSWSAAASPGLLFVQALVRRGDDVLASDPLAHRLELALGYGAEPADGPVDAAVLCAHAGLEATLDALEPGGTLILFSWLTDAAAARLRADPPARAQPASAPARPPRRPCARP